MSGIPLPPRLARAGRPALAVVVLLCGAAALALVLLNFDDRPRARALPPESAHALP